MTEDDTGGAFFVRWKRGEPREGRTFPPLAQDHPAHDRPCAACRMTLGNGTPVQLYVLGPCDEESERAHDSGQWYSALAELLHADCLAAVAQVYTARGIPEDSWLQQERYAEFRRAYDYAAGKYGAIRALGQLDAEDVYRLWSALQRGVEFHRRMTGGQGQMATREQLHRAVVDALRTAPWDGESDTNVSVAIRAMEHLLEQLGMPVQEGAASPSVSESRSPAGGELTSE